MKRTLVTLIFSGLSFSALSADLDHSLKNISAGNCDKGVAELTELAQANNAAAMNHLGALHLAGKCVSQDHKTGKVWIEKAAAAGSLRAQNMLKGLKK